MIETRILPRGLLLAVALAACLPGSSPGQSERHARQPQPEPALRLTFEYRDLAAYNQRLFELAVSGYFHDPARARELTPFRLTGRTQQGVWDSLGEDFDLRPALRRLDVPSIVVHGDDDPIPLETARATAEALRAEFVVLPDCGHVPYVEALPTFTAALDRFLPRG